MIGYLEGKIIGKEEDRILLLVNKIGYGILLPVFVMETLANKAEDEEISFYIYHYQTERQPTPILIGFNLMIEKEFFQHFISVEAIGPMKAVKAMTISVREISNAIESKDVATLKRLKGIGQRTAQKIIATLEGKVAKFVFPGDAPEIQTSRLPDDMTELVFDVLVNQLGYKTLEAKKIMIEALERNKTITTPEELLEEVYRGANS